MHRKSKIQYSTSYRQFDNISSRSIQKNTFLKDFYIEFRFKFFFIIKRFIIIDNILEFFDPFTLLLRNSDRSIVLHICKMCGYSKFRNIIHLMSSNLNFCRKTEHTKHSRMYALIPIEFGDSDIVLYFFDKWCIMFMDNSKYHITIAYRIGDDSIREQIHDITDFSSFISFL